MLWQKAKKDTGVSTVNSKVTLTWQSGYQNSAVDNVEWRLVRVNFLVVPPSPKVRPAPVQTYQVGPAAGRRRPEHPTAGACESLFQACPAAQGRHGHVTPSSPVPLSCRVDSRLRRDVPSPGELVPRRVNSDPVLRHRPRAVLQVVGHAEQWCFAVVVCRMMHPDCAVVDITSSGTWSSTCWTVLRVAAMQNSGDRSVRKWHHPHTPVHPHLSIVRHSNTFIKSKQKPCWRRLWHTLVSAPVSKHGDSVGNTTENFYLI